MVFSLSAEADRGADTDTETDDRGAGDAGREEADDENRLAVLSVVVVGV